MPFSILAKNYTTNVKEASNIPDWLKQTEQNSWQIELLISGGFIFALLQVPPYLKSVLYEIGYHSDLKSSLVIVFIGGNVLSRVLLIGFIVNLLLRSLWLAYLGIHYAFPSGVKYSKLNYHQKFEERFAQDYDSLNRILRLEKFCSLSYSLTIFLSIVFVGTLFSIAVFFWLVEKSEILKEILDGPVVGYSLILILVLSGFGLFDRLFFTIFRKKEKGTSRFYGFSKILSYLNGTWIFRYEWLTLISNVSRWKIHLITFVYVVLAFVLTLNDLGLGDPLSKGLEFNGFDNREFTNLPATGLSWQNEEYDENINAGDLIVRAAIPSEVISSNQLPIFIPQNQAQEETLKILFEKNKTEYRKGILKKTEEYDENTPKVQSILNEVFFVEFNEQKVDSIRWFQRRHSITEQKGLFTILDIHDLPKGHNDLKLKFIDHKNLLKLDTTTFCWIPFYKE